GRRLPLDVPPQDSVAEVEHALVGQQAPVADVERLVVDEQADDLAVGDVQDRLAGLGEAVSGLGIGEGPHLIERVQVGPGDPVRLPLVEIAAEADVPVREREHGLRLREHVQVELRFADAPRLDGEGGVGDHFCSSSSARSETTKSAPCSGRASRGPVRSTPTTKPKCPERPASTPASASSTTAASAGWTPTSFAAARNVSGAGLRRRCLCSTTIPSMRTSNRSSIPAASRTSLQFALADTTAVWSPASRTACTYRTEPS